MNTIELFSFQFQRVHDYYLYTLKDIQPEIMKWQPVKNANSVGFLLWHILRTWDAYLQFVDGSEELYDKNKLSLKFGFESAGKGVGGRGVGTGFTPEEAADVIPQPAALNEYLVALSERTTQYLKQASEKDLGKEIKVPWWPAPSSVAGVLIHILAHSFMHLGEAQYVKGMVTGG
jgi:uncharacterized damage-inducible protein DinB